jgi:hypothetical protein
MKQKYFNKYFTPLLLFPLVSLLFGCSKYFKDYIPDSPTTVTDTRRISTPSTLSLLENATIPEILDKPITFKNGIYKLKKSTLAKNFINNKLPTATTIDNVIAIDREYHKSRGFPRDPLNKNRIGAFFIENSGGNGYKTYFTLFNKSGNKIQPIATLDIGDRVALRDVAIHNNMVFLETQEHGPRDYWCCPSHIFQRKYILNENKFVEDYAKRKIHRLDLADLQQTTWTLKNLDSKKLPFTIGLKIKGERISGATPCNRFFGSIASGYRPLEITVGPLAQTKKQCDQKILNLENEFLNTLKQVDSFSFFEGKLALWYHDIPNEQPKNNLNLPTKKALKFTPSNNSQSIRTALNENIAMEKTYGKNKENLINQAPNNNIKTEETMRARPVADTTKNNNISGRKVIFELKK